MTSPDIPRNAYTHAPEQHPNLIVGSLQLLFWLIFHPSAWHNHLKRVDPNIRPDFCLTDLSQAQWKNPTLQKLLIQGYFVLPVMFSLFLGLKMLAVRKSAEVILTNILSNIGFTAAVGVTLGLFVNVGFGVASVLRIALSIIEPTGIVGMVVAFGLIGSVADTIADHKTSYSLGKVIGGVFGGFIVSFFVFTLFGLLMYVFVFGVVFLLQGKVIDFTNSEQLNNLFDEKRTLAIFQTFFSLCFGIAIGWSKGKWRLGVVVSVFFLLASLVIFLMQGYMIIAVLLGLIISLIPGIVIGRHTRKWKVGLGVTIAVLVGISIANIALSGIISSLILAAFFVPGERIAGIKIGATNLICFFGLSIIVSPTISYKVIIFIGIVLSLTINWWRSIILYPFLVAWNSLLYRTEKRQTEKSSALLRYNSAFWDEFQSFPLPGLDEHIVLIAECNQLEAEAAMEYLNNTHQRWAVQKAQIELDIRSLERCTDVKAIRQVHRKLEIGEIETPISPKLRLTSRISEDVDAALNQESAYNQRLALRYVADRIDLHLQEFNRSSDKYASRFYLIAKGWCEIITKYIEELAKETELRQEIDSPYIIGVPLTLQQEIFTGRNEIGTRIEQLLLDRRRPPLLLYGQRRMGKTSLLNNLGKLLPNSIIPLFVDLQGAPSSASDYVGFLYNLARGMITSAKRQSALTLPSLTREELEKDAFTSFDEWLDKVEQALQDNTALLSLDEFEVLDSAITKGRFDEQDVLGMLRNLIQHRPKFKVLIAGSHTIQEYQRWASYFINVQVVHISYLKEDEARQLIEHPVKDFTLRYEPDAVKRVLQLTRCHPFLVQLLCAEIVALKNEQNPSVRRLATLTDVEAGIAAAFSSGGFFFADIQNNQVDAAGLAILRFIATLGEGAIVSRKALSQQFPEVVESSLNLLLQRELIEEVGDGYKFQVELIRRWFAQ
ncbi:MAG: ATP-binding protein [Tolypothrix sp. Co-bin9]|nr:ATP-binding protein [Tolypothrix sp. Co-bin9]